MLKKLGRILIAIGVASVLALGVLPASPAKADVVDVYTTPGYHKVNGRSWHTTCARYSITTRCRTEIWADLQVIKRGVGPVGTKKGWAFNNLTYLPSPRKVWKNNPLGKTGSWTDAKGKKWRTECDTALTGRGGCRTFVVTGVWRFHKTSTFESWVMHEEEVLNNMVRFSD